MDVLTLGDVPACSTACIAQWCSPLVESCLCPNTAPRGLPWGEDLTNCLFENCTFAEQIVTCGATWKECRVPLQEISLVPLIVVVFLVSLCAFSIRVWAMFIRSSKLVYDDISITIAFIFLVCLIPCLALVQHYGFYGNVYSGHVKNLDHAAITFFVFKFLYALSMGWTKIAIVFLYFRILEGTKSRTILWATQAANLLVMLSFLVALPNACSPLRTYWAFSFDVPGSTCDDLWDWGGYYTGFNLALDVWMIVVPVYTILRLQMDAKAKLGVIAMFCLGFATMVMTIMRFVAMRSNANTFLADDLKNGMLWSTLEPTIAFIVACIPSIRLVLRARLPQIVSKSRLSFGRSKLRSGGGGGGGGTGQDPAGSASISSSRGGDGTGYSYVRAQSESQRGLFDTHGTRFELSSPVKSADGPQAVETELPSRY